MPEPALSLREVRAVIRQLFPPGRLYDWFNTKAKIYKLINATAQTFKQYGFEMVDTLRRETTPRTLVQNLPTYEGALGIAETQIARNGTTAQRQAAVIAKFRESGGFTKKNVQSVIAPLLGYNLASTLEVIECDRELLRLHHSYTPAVDTTISAGATTTVEFLVSYDGGNVAPAGAFLTLYFSTNDLSQYSFVLTGPNGTQKTWNRAGGWTSVPLCLYGKEFAGKVIQGPWRLAITNASGAPSTLYSGSTLFVEGVQPVVHATSERGQQLTGAAIFSWAAYADSTHLGENGVAADLPSARRALQRIRHAHTRAELALALTAYPGQAGSFPGGFFPA